MAINFFLRVNMIQTHRSLLENETQLKKVNIMETRKEKIFENCIENMYQLLAP